MRGGSSRTGTVGLLLLGAVVVALGLANWWVLTVEPGASSAESVSLANLTATAAPTARPLAERSLSDFGEIVGRPLFTATRRPYVPADPVPVRAEPAAAEPRRPPPNVRLIGIVIDAGKKRALLRTPGQPRGRWVEEGETIDGWQVRRVLTDAAILALGPGTHELRLYPAREPSAANR
jgi:general secretion pathway protein N